MKKVAILFIVLLTSSFVFAQNTYVPDDKFEQAYASGSNKGKLNEKECLPYNTCNIGINNNSSKVFAIDLIK